MIVRSSQPQPAPCGMNGLACPGNCASCTGRPGLAGNRGMGAFYDAWPSPLNNPLVLAAIALVALMVFGGFSFKQFLSGGRKGSARRAKLRLIRADAEQQRAKVLAS